MAGICGLHIAGCGPSLRSAVIEAGDPAAVEENASLIAENLAAAGDMQLAYGWHMRAAYRRLRPESPIGSHRGRRPGRGRGERLVNRRESGRSRRYAARLWLAYAGCISPAAARF